MGNIGGEREQKKSSMQSQPVHVTSAVRGEALVIVMPHCPLPSPLPFPCMSRDSPAYTKQMLVWTHALSNPIRLDRRRSRGLNALENHAP